MSKEGILPILEFRLASNGIGSSGPVVVEGSINPEGEVASLSVQVFEKTYNIEGSVLKTIGISRINGIQISYEAGYRVLGGRTVYILFQKGFTSETKEKYVLAVSEHEKPELLDKGFR